MSTKVTTPKGIAKYPSLIKPDTRFNEAGVYKTGLVVKASEAEALKAQCEEEFVNEYGKGKLAKAIMPVRPVLDEEGNETGDVEIVAKSKNQPKFFDSKGNPIKDLEVIDRLGGGSKLRLAGAIKAYNQGKNMGVTFYINSVQVITYVEYNSAAFKAEDEDDGFEAGDSFPQSKPKAAPKDDAADEDIDF